MKALYLILFILLTLFPFIKAQVLDGDTTLTTQADINNFNFISVTGNLTINSSEITNLNGLSSLNSVGGDFFLYQNSALTNLNGLSNLTSVGRDLIMIRNHNLINLDGLSNLNSIGGELNIFDNTSLTNLDGLSNRTFIGENLEISHNTVLTNLSGLNKLTSVGSIGQSIALIDNSSLKSLNVFNNLTFVGGNLLVSTNDSLITLDGLNNITYVAGYLSVDQNASLINLDGLGKLTSIGGILAIAGNPSLTSINSLSNLFSVGENFVIGGNASLTNLDGLGNFTSIGGDLNIYSNPELLDINGLSNLTSVGGDLKIQFNNILNEFCGLFRLLNGNGLTGEYIVSGNESNPLAEEIISKGICVDYALEEAIEDVQNLPLGAGNKNALTSKLQNALAKYNAGDFIAAKNILNAFLNQLNQFVANGVLTIIQAQSLIDYVNQIIAAINSSLPKAENETSEQLPKEFVLNQNYPNPFNPSTTISYQLPVGGYISLKVYDILGNEVASLVNGTKEAGYYQINLDASSLSSGMYIYRLITDNNILTKKMQLIK